MISLFAFIYAVFKLTTKRRIEKIDEQIKSNDNEISKLDGKVEQLETQKQDILEDITDTKQTIETLQEIKEQPIEHVSRTTAEARENILNKTTRKRKKSNN
jgi:peptidoglycan hydrolase CwlO-like protein